MTVAHEIADDGKVVPFGSLPKAVTYSADGAQAYVDVEYLGISYRKTITYAAGRLVSETAWEAQ